MNAKFFGWAVFLILGLAGAARASAPVLMNYQGRIKEAGVPVTGSRSVNVQICSALTGGDCVDTGAQGVSVVNGLFRTTFTAPVAIAWETGEWYLEISVGGTPFTPRERLASAPYAIYASSAATLVPNPGAASVFIASSVVIADTGFSVGGTALAVSGAGVGAGTATPASTLDVKGTLTLSGVAHVHATGAGGSTPLVGAGGGAGCAGATVAGSDSVGRMTMGGGGGGPCSLVFGTAWTGNVPVCFFQDETAPVQQISAIGPTTIFVNFDNFNAGDVISYFCLSY